MAGILSINIEDCEFNRKILFDYLNKCLLLMQIDTVKLDGYAYYRNHSDELIILRVYKNTNALKLIIPAGFDRLNATLMRKKLEYLDLGTIHTLDLSIKNIPNLKTLIAKDLKKFARCVVFENVPRLDYINLDKLEYIDSFIFKAVPSLKNLSLKGCLLLQKECFSANYKLTQLIISSKLKEIQTDAFCNTSLKEVIYYGTETEFENILISANNKKFVEAKVIFMSDN